MRTINKRDCIGRVVICAFFLWGSRGLCSTDDEILTINSPILRIKFELPPEMKDSCEQVMLWYRVDGGRWQRGGKYKVSDAIEFATSADGMHEFAILPLGEPGPGNDGGSSSAGFKCLVDSSQPVIQIAGTKYQDGNLTVRWRAYDKNFSDRPIEIYLLSDSGSKLLGRFANHSVGVIPVEGGFFPARVKVVAVDRAGNYGVDVSEVIASPVATHSAAPSPMPTTRPVTKEVEPPVAEPSAPVSENPDAMREFRLGTNYRLRGELDLACVHLKRAAELDSKMTGAHVDLAGVFTMMGRYNDAVNAYLQALVLDDKSVKAWQGLGMARIRQSQYQQAVMCLEKATELDKKNLQALMYLGDAYWTLGYRSEAKGVWVRAKGLLTSESLPEIRQGIESRLTMAK